MTGSQKQKKKSRRNGRGSTSGAPAKPQAFGSGDGKPVGRKPGKTIINPAPPRKRPLLLGISAFVFCAWVVLLMILAWLAN